MGTYFLGSTGSAEAFRMGEDGQPEIMFTSKTLMETGININIQRERIRGGEGAAIQFEFSHSLSVDINLIDAVFKTDYIETQLGADFSNVGDEDNESYQSEKVNFSNGVAYLSKEVRPLPINCEDGIKYIAWGCKFNDDEWYILDVDETDRTKIILPGANGEYCVSYLAQDMNARVAEITTSMIPQEFFLIITVPLFAGDPCNASQSKSAGYVQFEIPRFQPSGSMEFTMSASEFSPVNISGQALATPHCTADCDQDILMRIIEVVLGRSWTDDIVKIFIDPDTAYVGETPVFYAVLKSGETIKLNLSDMIYRRNQLFDYILNIPDDFVFESAGTYYFNLFDELIFRANDGLFLVLDQMDSSHKVLRVSAGGRSNKLDTDTPIEIGEAMDLSNLYYDNDIYFI